MVAVGPGGAGRRLLVSSIIVVYLLLLPPGLEASSTLAAGPSLRPGRRPARCREQRHAGRAAGHWPRAAAAFAVRGGRRALGFEHGDGHQSCWPWQAHGPPARHALTPRSPAGQRRGGLPVFMSG